MSDLSCADPRGCQSPEFCKAIEGCDRYGEIRDERAREALPMPQCCEKASLGLAVRPALEVTPSGDYTPVWYVSQSDFMRQVFNKHDFPVTEAKFCPFCGQHLPEFVKRENPPEPLCRIDASERCCETCEDRLPCACYTPLCAWGLWPTREEK